MEVKYIDKQETKKKYYRLNNVGRFFLYPKTGVKKWIKNKIIFPVLSAEKKWLVMLLVLLK